MRPDQHDLDEEIRGHLALSIKERIDRGRRHAPRAWTSCRRCGANDSRTRCYFPAPPAGAAGRMPGTALCDSTSRRAS